MAPHQSNRGRLLGYYVGDELLAQGLSVSSLTAVFDLLKETWPNATTYYNEEWSVINDPSWRDKDGKPYVIVPDSLGKCTRSLSSSEKEASERRVQTGSRMTTTGLEPMSRGSNR